MAARQFGYRTKIAYFPWTRAMQLGTRDPQYAGYFPACDEPLAERSLHVCFQRTPAGHEKAFDQARQALPLRPPEAEYLQRIEKR